MTAMSAANPNGKKLQRALIREKEFVDKLSETEAAKRLQHARNELLEAIRAVGRSGDVFSIVATEQAIVKGDLSRYANSPEMTNSLKNAVTELTAVERHLGIVDDPARYRAVDQDHGLPRNRKGGLPFDEARQALGSHYARLNNLSKSRVTFEEKKIIDARKSAMGTAGKLYAERQAKTLGVFSR